MLIHCFGLHGERSERVCKLSSSRAKEVLWTAAAKGVADRKKTDSFALNTFHDLTTVVRGDRVLMRPDQDILR